MVFKTKIMRASASYNKKLKKWDWEPVLWKLGKDNIYYSNRHYPKKFWENRWDRTQRDVAGVLLFRHNKNNNDLEIFIVQCYKNKWGFPKGKINKGETFIKGACREFYEETGSNIDLNKNCKINIIDNSKRRKIIFFYKVMDSDFEIETRPIADSEITAYGWIPLTRILNYSVSNVSKKVLKKISLDTPPDFPNQTKETLEHLFNLLVKGGSYIRNNKQIEIVDE